MNHAVVCACGRRYEYEPGMGSDKPWWHLLKTERHDPDECSGRVGYQDRLDGASRMVEIALRHLNERKTLSGEEIAEIGWC